MPLSLGNLGSRVRLQAGAALTNRSVSLCRAMAMSDDLSFFRDVDDGMDEDDSEDEVDETDQPIVSVTAPEASQDASVRSNAGTVSGGKPTRRPWLSGRMFL